MKKKTEFTVTHVILKASKEEKEIHMKQVYTALLKMANKESSSPEKELK